MDNVIVTGGSRGLGLAIAKRLALSGYCAIAVARAASDEFTTAAQEATQAKTGSLRFVACDLAELDAIPQLVSELRSEYGSIYGLVNNAAASAEGLLATMHNSQIEYLLRINAVSPIVLTKYVVRGMMSERRGRIVNISSIIASTGFRALSVYGASKASMIGFTKSLAREVGELGITVNAIAPGFLETSMTRSLDGEGRSRIARRSALRRLAEVDDVANAVDYLVGEKGRNITGTVVTIDAGGTA